MYNQLNFFFKESLDLLEKEAEKRNAIEQARKKAEAEIKSIQFEVQDLEAKMAKSEQSR